MKPFHVTISGIDGDAFDGEALNLSLRGMTGDLAVMAGHMPMITTVRPGSCRVTLPDESVREGSTGGGILAVTPERTILLSEGFEWAE